MMDSDSEVSEMSLDEYSSEAYAMSADSDLDDLIEPMKEDKPELDSLISYSKVPTLEKISSCKIVFPIWHNYFSQVQNIDYEFFTPASRYLLDVYEVLKLLGTHPSIIPILEKCAEHLHDVMGKWMQHFRTNIFFSSDLLKYSISDFNPTWCVWRWDGHIDYGMTARRMASSPDLRFEQKFGIMCVYCMVDKINELSFNSLPSEFSGRVQNNPNSSIQNNPDYMIDYWLTYLQSEFNKHTNDTPLTMSAASMATECRNEHWTALKYFWTLLNLEEQMKVAISRLCNSAFEKLRSTQDKLFNLMSRSQREVLLFTKPDTVLLNFWLHVESPQLAMRTWKRVKYLMTAEQFAIVVGEVFAKRVFVNEEIQLLIEIWDEAPNHFKNYAVENLTDMFVQHSLFKKTTEPEFYCLGSVFMIQESKLSDRETAFKFLSKFLSATEVNYRRNFMFEKAAKFGDHIFDLRWMSEMFTLCLPDSQDQIGCKKLILDLPTMKRHLVELFDNKYFYEFNLIIEFYSSDAKAAQEYTKKLIASKETLDKKIIFSLDKWLEFRKYIGSTFSNEPSEISDAKKFISSLADDSSSSCWGWGSLDNISNLIKVIEHYYTPEEIIALKPKILKCYKLFLVNYSTLEYDFDVDCFDKIVRWCVDNDEEAYRDIKTIIPIDDIFDGVLSQLEEIYVDDSKYEDTPLQNFGRTIKWFFSSNEEAEHYKLCKLETLMLDVGFNRKCFFKYLQRNEIKLQSYLSWFYEVDEVSLTVVREFEEQMAQALEDGFLQE